MCKLLSSGSFIAFPFQMYPRHPAGPSDRVTHWREEQAIYVLQMFTFSKDTSKSAYGAHPCPANT